MKINIVLYHPEIPQNTANIIRTVVAMDATLHLIKPYGFEFNLDHHIMKRGSTNYAEDLKYVEYNDFKEFEQKNQMDLCRFITRHGTKLYTEAVNENQEEIYYVFGSESSGIDREILNKYPNQLCRIPTIVNMRSLNLSNCVALVAYDGLRQVNFNDLSKVEVLKKDFLKGETNNGN